MEKREIDWEKVDYMFVCGANITQTAAAIGVCKDTLYRRCKEDRNQTLQSIYEEKREKGNNLIHIAQYEKAIKEKNPTMLIWLGKQRLQQKEQLDQSIAKDIEKKFDEKMDQVLSLLSNSSERNIEESNINNETKS